MMVEEDVKTLDDLIQEFASIFGFPTVNKALQKYLKSSNHKRNKSTENIYSYFNLLN